MISGPSLFARFAFPPNALGYCGPNDVTLLHDLAAGESGVDAELQHVATAFAGAWPYLELIAQAAVCEPLDYSVVEAYWLGNDLLDRIDVLTWGNSLDERFRMRAGGDWDAIAAGINDGGRPTHSFHVYCVYPWVGLLRSGMVDQALGVLDQCRIRWGVVEDVMDGRVFARSQPLVWDGERLHLGAERVESVDASVDPVAVVGPGDLVAMHWNYVCQAISQQQLARLQHGHARHLAIVNQHTRRLANAVER